MSTPPDPSPFRPLPDRVDSQAPVDAEGAPVDEHDDLSAQGAAGRPCVPGGRPRPPRLARRAGRGDLGRRGALRRRAPGRRPGRRPPTSPRRPRPSSRSAPTTPTRSRASTSTRTGSTASTSPARSRAPSSRRDSTDRPPRRLPLAARHVPEGLRRRRQLYHPGPRRPDRQDARGRTSCGRSRTGSSRRARRRGTRSTASAGRPRASSATSGRRTGSPSENIVIRWGYANQTLEARERDSRYLTYEVNLARRLGLSVLATEIGTVETFNQDQLVSSVGARSRYQMMPDILRMFDVEQYSLPVASGGTVQVSEEQHPLLADGALPDAGPRLRQLGRPRAPRHLGLPHRPRQHLQALPRVPPGHARPRRAASTSRTPTCGASRTGSSASTTCPASGPQSRVYVLKAYGALARDRGPADRPVQDDPRRARPDPARRDGPTVPDPDGAGAPRGPPQLGPGRGRDDLREVPRPQPAHRPAGRAGRRRARLGRPPAERRPRATSPSGSSSPPGPPRCSAAWGST